MKVNSNRDISFKSLYTNKIVKKSLEFAADNGALFAASATVGYSLVARPAAIWLTPDTDKENRKLALAKSLSSSFTGFVLMLLASKPIANSIKKIDKNPDNYLSKSALSFYKNGKNDIYNSKSYTFATQMFKLGIGLVVSVPKAILTASGIPFVMKGLFNEKDSENKNISFKGKNNNLIAKSIGKNLSSKNMQKFSEKYKDTNFVMHIVAATDALTTGTFIYETKKSEKIKEERKKALIYNAGISTGLSIISSYIIDKLLDKPTQKFIEKYKIINQTDKNVKKQVQGIKVAKPILIMGTIYYVFIPFLSTYLAEIIDKKDDKKGNS